jgi:hypothetical protein
MLWHRSREFGIPNLSVEGWERVRLPETDVAFRRDNDGVRARCGNGHRAPREHSRDLWLGIARETIASNERTVASVPAHETIARSDDLRVHTVVVKSSTCLIDAVHVVRADLPGDAFERFLSRIEVRTP